MKKVAIVMTAVGALSLLAAGCDDKKEDAKPATAKPAAAATATATAASKTAAPAGGGW